jgi:hypothetical protein
MTAGYMPKPMPIMPLIRKLTRTDHVVTLVRY